MKTVVIPATVSKFTALDAAGPLFEDSDVCLNSSAAAFVDAIHTSAGDGVVGILTGKLGASR